MTATPWRFCDPPNVAVFVAKSIAFGDDWIYFVGHNQEDGAWEFHPKCGFAPANELAVLALRRVVEMDDAIAALWDLPPGWCAWRETKDAPWSRAKMETT